MIYGRKPINYKPQPSQVKGYPNDHQAPITSVNLGSPQAVPGQQAIAPTVYQLPPQPAPQSFVGVPPMVPLPHPQSYAPTVGAVLAPPTYLDFMLSRVIGQIALSAAATDKALFQSVSLLVLHSCPPGSLSQEALQVWSQILNDLSPGEELEMEQKLSEQQAIEGDVAEEEMDVDPFTMQQLQLQHQLQLQQMQLNQMQEQIEEQSRKPKVPYYPKQR